MKVRRISFAIRILIIISAMLLLANVLLGVVLSVHSKNAYRNLIERRMLDISNSAAALLDGDVMAELKAEDSDTPEYQEALRILGLFQQNIELQYIYGVRDMGDGTFTFTIDPEPVSPGEFGSPVVTTPALVRASEGIASVDQEPYTDQWGSFYSSYSPIFDSNGKVSGIVAVDFSAQWYDNQLRQSTYYVVLASIVSMLVGALVVLIITSRVRKRFAVLLDDVGNMAVDLQQLTDEAEKISNMDLSDILKKQGNYPEDVEGQDDIQQVKNKIDKMHDELKIYLKYVQMQAYKDSMTGISNKTAYLELVHKLQRDIELKKASFSVVVFDINGLKTVNDNFGHEEGDSIIISTGNVLKRSFGEETLFRIGGDEFIAVIPNTDDAYIKTCFALLDKAIDEVNNVDKNLPVELSISRGMAKYMDGDKDYNVVFKRADDIMYKNKAEYYKNHEKKRG